VHFWALLCYSPAPWPCQILDPSNSLSSLTPGLIDQNGPGAARSLGESLLQACSLLLGWDWGLGTETTPHSSQSFLSPAVPGVCDEGARCGVGL
jgi:hypothetical protein